MGGCYGTAMAGVKGAGTTPESGARVLVGTLRFVSEEGPLARRAHARARRPRRRPAQDVQRARPRSGPDGRGEEPRPAREPRGQGGRRRRVRHRARRGRRLPRPERRRQDDDAEDAQRPPLPDRRARRSSSGYVPSRRERPFLRQITMVMGNRNQLQWDLPALDSFELIRAIYRLDAGRLPEDPRRVRRAARPRRARQQARPQPVARRADEDGVRRGAAPQAASSCSSTSRRSASTSRCRSGSGRSSPSTTGATARRSC